jgi:hypothetical protein
MIDDEEKDSIRNALQNSRREGLAIFLEEFMGLLAQEGFSFPDLLEALASWSFRRRLKPNSVIKHLEDASLEIYHSQHGINQ